MINLNIDTDVDYRNYHRSSIIYNSLNLIVVEGRNVDECYYIDSIGCMNDYDLNWQPTEVTWL